MNWFYMSFIEFSRSELNLCIHERFWKLNNWLNMLSPFTNCFPSFTSILLTFSICCFHLFQISNNYHHKITLNQIFCKLDAVLVLLKDLRSVWYFIDQHTFENQPYQPTSTQTLITTPPVNHRRYPHHLPNQRCQDEKRTFFFSKP